MVAQPCAAAMVLLTRGPLQRRHRGGRFGFALTLRLEEVGQQKRKVERLLGISFAQGKRAF